MPSLKLSNGNFKWIAEEIGCEPEMVMAVTAVECKREPFDSDGFPAILFERHIFYRKAPAHKRDEWARQYPRICNRYPTPPGGYGSYSAQRGFFSQAFALDRDAAMKACSWGPFQEMGMNYADYGFDTVGEFVDTMKDGLGGACEIFIKSIKHRGIDDDMREHRYSIIARLYNGANYKKFHYDDKIEDEYRQAKRRQIPWDDIVATEPSRKGNPAPIDTFVEEVDSDPVEPSPAPGDEDPGVLPVPPDHSTQVAENITNVNQGSSTVPENFVPKAVNVDAPPPSGILTKAKLWLAGLGIGIPSTAGIFEAIKGASADGTIDIKEIFLVGKEVFALMLPYAAGAGALFLIFWGLKELLKQASFMLTQYTMARRDMHNVFVRPVESKQPAPQLSITEVLK